MRGIETARHLEALGTLHHASKHLAGQCEVNWPRRLAAGNLEARALIFNAANAILEGHGIGILSREVARELTEMERLKANG
jgi:hypothetical protein